MDPEPQPITITELSSSPYIFRKSLYRRRSLSEFDPKLGDDIQNLLKTTDRNSLSVPDAEKAQDVGNEIPIFSKLLMENSQQPIEQRRKNITEAIDWVKVELKSLKKQDKSLMRQFLDLRTSINQFKDEMDPFEDLGFCARRRSMSMVDHLNQEKRNSRFALARSLIEDINTVEEMGLTDSEDEAEDTDTTTEEANVSLLRGRPITPSVSIAAKDVQRPFSALIRGSPHVTKAAETASGRPVSDSVRLASRTTHNATGYSSSGIPLTESEDTKL